MRELTPELRAVVALAGAAQGAYEVEGLILRVCRSVATTFGLTFVVDASLLGEQGLSFGLSWRL